MNRPLTIAATAVAATFTVGGGLLVATSSQAATVATVEAETMNTVEGYGATVRTDTNASAGKYLRVDSNVRVRKTVDVPSAAGSVTVRARTDAGVTPARMVVTVDGAAFPETVVAPATWTDFTLPRQFAAGSHTVTVRFMNSSARNLHLDVVRFADAGSTPTTTTTGTTSTTTTTAPSNETTTTGLVTGYSYYDNDPPGSGEIAYPNIRNRGGASGTGTYTDPLTAAVPAGSPYAPGETLYLPHIDRYVIVEDACAVSHSAPDGCTAYVDVWVDGRDVGEARADACMSQLTGNYPVVRRPRSDHPVASGSVCAGSTPLRP